MGRRGIAVEDESRWVFNRLASAYRLRPGYPAALIERLARASAGGPVVDLGAGTGHLALPLARAGIEVAAVDPARAMRDALASAAHGLPISIRGAPAEETGLPPGAFGLAVVADALHWVDPDRTGREVARLLRAGGSAAVIEPRLADTPYHRELAALLSRANPKARRRTESPRALQLLSLAVPGAPVAVERYRHEVLLDAEGLESVLLSLSFVGPALGPEALAALLGEARWIAMRHGGAVWSREIVLTGAGPAFLP